MLLLVLYLQEREPKIGNVRSIDSQGESFAFLYILMYIRMRRLCVCWGVRVFVCTIVLCNRHLVILNIIALTDVSNKKEGSTMAQWISHQIFIAGTQVCPRAGEDKKATSQQNQYHL